VTETEKNGLAPQFDLKELIQPTIATILIFMIRILLAYFKLTPQVPDFLKDKLTAEQLTTTIAGVLWLIILAAIFVCQRWRNRRKHVEGQPKPGKVAIYVAELEGDGRKGAHRTNIIQTLKRGLGASVQILRAGIELCADEAGNVADEASTANRKAQKYIRKHKGDLLIWGQVLPGPPVVIELRFSSPMHDGTDEKRFNYNEKFRLEEGFGHEIGAALAGVAAQQALPAFDIGNYVANVLIPVAEKLAHLIKNLPASMGPGVRGLLLVSYANAEAAIGNQSGDSWAFIRSIKAYRAALKTWTRESVPFMWARTQLKLGMALMQLGFRESGTARSLEAIAAFRAALEVFTRKQYPLYWAMTQCNLGSSLYAHGYREISTARLEESVVAFRAALDVFTQKRNPHQWAITQCNLSNTLTTLGFQEHNTALLQESMTACDEALEVFTRDDDPLLWAATQCERGAALRALGTLENSTERLEEAGKAFRAALKEQHRDRVPLAWAGTQDHLGSVYHHLGYRESGTASLEKSVVFYTATLEEYTRKHTPLLWAKTQLELGRVLHLIGIRASSNAHIVEAVQAYQAALQVFRQESNPFDWAKTQQNHGRALEILERLPEAAACYRQALTVFTLETYAQDHAEADQDLARVLEKLCGDAESG
jgi:tetratricopeptide (TPR) repeat protein